MKTVSILTERNSHGEKLIVIYHENQFKYLILTENEWDDVSPDQFKTIDVKGNPSAIVDLTSSFRNSIRRPELMIEIQDRFLELAEKRDEIDPIVIIEWLKEEGYSEEDIFEATDRKDL
jgi:hypothetical protein